MQSAIHTTPTCPCCSSLHRPRAALLSTSCVSPTRCEWDPGDTCGAWQGNNRRVVNFQASEARSLCRLPTQNILAERANRSVLTQTGALGEAQRLQAWGSWGDSVLVSVIHQHVSAIKYTYAPCLFNLPPTSFPIPLL